MKFLIVGDLHGSKPKVQFKGFDAIIAPGDFCSSDRLRKYYFQVLQARLEGKDEKPWYELAGKDKAKKLVEESLKAGRGVLEYLNSFGVPVYIVPGNTDWAGGGTQKMDLEFLQNRFPELVKGLENIKNTASKIVDVDGYQIIGYGPNSGPEYPQHDDDKKAYSKKRLEELKQEYDDLKKRFSDLFQKATKPVIFLGHNVPFGTDIDLIVNPESPRNGWHYGSLVVRDMNNQFQPLVSIGGHMHEHFGKVVMGKTTAINTGFGPNVNTWLELEGNEIKKLEFKRA